MASIITIAGEKLFAAKAQANEQLDIDTFIFANVPGQDAIEPISREEGIPTDHVVHQQIVQQVGRINDNVVVYSTVLDSITGPFEFNWVGLYSSINDTLVAINHVPTTPKTATAAGVAGNTLNRNFGIEYSGIADLTGIDVAPETWQLDFTARLQGMDKLTQQLAADMNGKDWFIEDGFKVEPRETINTFKILPGVGYVSGLRVELENEHIFNVESYPQFVYVDAWFEGDANSTWSPSLMFTVSDTEIDDYTDAAGIKHYVNKLAELTEFDKVEDLRPINGLPQKVDNHLTQGKHDAYSIEYVVGDALKDLQRAAIVYEKTVIVKVPSDYATLQQAVDAISGVNTSGNTEVIINIEADHKLTQGLGVFGGDYSAVRITSDDAIVYLDESFTGVNTDVVTPGILGETPRPPLFFGYRCKYPTIDCVVDMNNKHGTGLQLAEAEGVVTPGNGVQNAGFRGIQVHGRANIYGAKFPGASGTGLRMQQASSCNARSANFDYCCKNEEETSASVYASRGVILEFRGGSATHSGGKGLIARRSLVNADDSDFSYGEKGGVFAESQGAQVAFSRGKALNVNAGAAVRSGDGGVVYAGVAQLSRPSAPHATININGSQIWVNAGTSVNGLYGEAEIIAASNVNYLNAFDSNGCIIFNGGVGTFEVGYNSYGWFEKKSNGRLTTWSGLKNILVGELQAGEWTGDLQLPTLPHAFYEIYSVNIEAVGRTSADGGGYRVAVHDFHRLTAEGNEFKVQNTGVQLGGNLVDLQVRTIQLMLSVEGRWR